MSVTFIRNNITKLKVDAIVNAANNELRGGGGVDGAIHRAAGSELYAYCQTLGGCPTGGAKISPGFNLPAKYIIHTVGPVWRGGAFHEKTLLTSCYLRSLELAQKHGCKTVAFPLISAGAYGYPYNDALQVAYDTCNLFLKETKADIDIFIVLYQGSQNVRRHTNRTAFELPDATVFKRVAAYIRENYHFDAEEAKMTEADSPEDGVLDSSGFIFSEPDIRFQMASEPPTQSKKKRATKQAKKHFTDFEEGLDFSCDMGSASAMTDSLPAPAKEKKLLHKRSFQMASGDFAGPRMLDRENLPVEETFTQMLLRFMEEKHMTPPELYNNACLDRKLFSKIQSNIDYQPKKYTAVRLALALQLSPEETDALLETAGFALSRSKITDLVISYCIANNKRAVWEVNGILEDWGLATI